jgi:hypothetical protein
VFRRNSFDVDVVAPVVVQAAGVRWSNTNPCTGILLVTGASVVHDNGTCTQP